MNDNDYNSFFKIIYIISITIDLIDKVYEKVRKYIGGVK